MLLGGLLSVTRAHTGAAACHKVAYSVWVVLEPPCSRPSGTTILRNSQNMCVFHPLRNHWFYVVLVEVRYDAVLVSLARAAKTSKTAVNLTRSF